MHFTLPLTTIILGFGSAAAQGSPSPDVVLIYPASSIQANQPFNLGYSATIVDARQTVTFSLTAPNGTNPTGSDEPDTSDGCNGTSSPLNFVTMSLSDLGRLVQRNSDVIMFVYCLTSLAATLRTGTSPTCPVKYRDLAPPRPTCTTGHSLSPTRSEVHPGRIHRKPLCCPNSPPPALALALAPAAL
jgi:hypothetical protein